MPPTTGARCLRTDGDPRLDLIIEDARLPDAVGGDPVDIGIAGGLIVAIGRDLGAPPGTPSLDAGGRLVAAGFVDSHIDLDKSCIMDRCRCERGDLAEAIAETARAKSAFTPEAAVAELAPVLHAFKRGRLTVGRTPAVLHRR